jgi:hypothetical protein
MPTLSNQELPGKELLNEAYRSFNARDLESALALMDPEVDWPNSMEGGRVHGHAGVRDYWTRQWATINPNVTPLRFSDGGEGRIVLDVHQVVLDLQGNVLIDTVLEHIYTFSHGLIARMDIGNTIPT